MEELIKVKTMSSREIAEVAKRQHKDVLESIRNMEPAWEKVTGRKFPLSNYTDPTGRKLPMYELNKKECLYVATKFNDEVRAKLIIRWEELETKQALDFSDPDTILMLAQTWKEERQKRLEAEQRVVKIESAVNKLSYQNSLMKPKVELMKRILNDKLKVDIGQAAKILNLPFGRNTLFKKLKEKGVIFKNRNEPKPEYIKKGYFEMKKNWSESNRYDGVASIKVLVTQKGLEFIAQLFGVISSENNNNININN
jgi:phage regulator Rha-like protein